MSVSNLRFVKSETRDMAEADRLNLRRTWHRHEPTEWHMQSSTFVIALVACAFVLALAAMILR